MSSYQRNASGGTTNHAEEIASLRASSQHLRHLPATSRRPHDESVVIEACALDTAAALLEVHDASGISLDSWAGPRELVELLIGERFLENHV